jgi:hypothetical protein
MSYHVICLEGAEENNEIRSQNSRYAGRDLTRDTKRDRQPLARQLLPV